MWINYLLLIVGGALSLLCAVALTLFPMHPKDVESQAAIWLGHIGLDTWGEGLTTTTDDWISAGLWALLIVCIILLFVALIRMFRRSRGGTANTTDPPGLPTQDAAVPELAEPGEDDFSDFDVPIRDAIDHLVHTTPHSFNRSSLAEQSAFRALLEAMRAGRLPVIGMKGEHAMLEEISPSHCMNLYPIEMATPHGVRFHLVNETEITKPSEPFIERSDPLGFSGLRVRSGDLHRIWPRNQPAMEKSTT